VIGGYRAEQQLLGPALLLLGLLLVQLTLGAYTIWTRRAVLPMTAHVAVGAAVLATSLLLTLRAFRLVVSPTGARAQGFFSEQVMA
jgi:heme A synthase